MKYEFKPSHIVPAFLFVAAVLYGGSKPPCPTNTPPGDVSGGLGNPAAPVNGETMGGLVALRGRGLSQTSQVGQQGVASGGLGNPAAPVMFEVLSNWTARGAYCDWQRIDFPDAFRFPVGTNFIDAVTLLSYGEIRANLHCSTSTSRFDYSLPARVSLEPGVSAVTHGLTPSNSYLFAWRNCCVERCATNRVDASIELFRSGAVVTTFNGEVGRVAPRPPEGWVGIGQDDDWIRATFPEEADAILAKGYENWVHEDYVGINEQNGHYLARVTVSQPPASYSQPPIYLVCGPYRVNVVEPGTYSFPLEVFETYEVRTYPDAVPFTVDFDDGYAGDGSSYEMVDASPRPRLLVAPPGNASSSLTFYRFYMKPFVIVSPNHISRNRADGARVSLWCNIANVTRRYVRKAAREFYLNFCWPSDAEIEAADKELEDELAAEDDEIEVVYECPRGECSGWLYIDGVPEPPRREDAAVYAGPVWQAAYSNGCRYCQLTVTTTDGSTETHEEVRVATLPAGQSAAVSVFMATTEPNGDVYDDEVEWQVFVNGTAAMCGSASVSSGASGGQLAGGRFDPPADGALQVRLVGRARNVGDGLRQSFVRIAVTATDEGGDPAQP